MMGNISNFARQDTVSVVEFADYLRECLPPVQWPEAAAERDTWRQRLPYSLVVKLFYPQLDFAERWCWLTFGECFGECLQRQSEYPSCFEPLPHCHNGRWRARWLAKNRLRFRQLRMPVRRRRSLPPLCSLRAENRIRRKLRLKRPSETPLSPDTQPPRDHRFQTAKQLETRQSMVKSVVFSVSSVIHF